MFAAVPILACGVTGAVTEAAFVTTCTAECGSAGADRALCESYCQCGYAYARDNDRLDELNNVQVVPGQAMPPVIVDLMSECGSDVWDSNFRRSCMQSCEEGDACQARCDCFLRELRGPGPRAQSTRFLIENLDVSPPTAAGSERLEAAGRACAP